MLQKYDSPLNYTDIILFFYDTIKDFFHFINSNRLFLLKYCYICKKSINLRYEIENGS